MNPVFIIILSEKINRTLITTEFTLCRIAVWSYFWYAFFKLSISRHTNCHNKWGWIFRISSNQYQFYCLNWLLSAWKLQDPHMNFPWVNILWFCFLLARPILTQYNKVFMRQFVFENLSYLMNPRYVKFQVFFNFLSTINLWNKEMFKKAMVQVNIPNQWGVTSLSGQ